jgi:hypothetical protein
MNETPPPLPPEQHDLSLYIRSPAKELRSNPALRPGGQHFDALIHHYLPLVYGTALKLVPESAESAHRISESAFELLAVKWNKVVRGRRGSATLIALFLQRAAVSASIRERKRLRLKKPERRSTAAGYLLLFKRFFQLNKKSQRSLLIFNILNYPPASNSPKVTSLQQYADKKVRCLSRKLRKTSLPTDTHSVLADIPVTAPAELSAAIIDSIRRWNVAAPRSELTRATILTWRLLAVRTFIKRVLATLGATVSILALIVTTFIVLATHGFFPEFFMEMGRRDTLKKHPELAQPARPWPVTADDQARIPSSPPRTSDELFQQTNIWLARLTFTRESWKDLQPDRVERQRLFQNGKIILRNPNAKRSGLAGMLGYDFNWAEAQFEFAGLNFTNVAARYRGNGTFVDSLFGNKQSFKVDLNKFTKKQKLAGLDELNFVNSIPDVSHIHDSMAERFFRDFGVAAPRTTYAYLSINVPGKWTNQPLGLYNIIENIDTDFAENWFGTKKVPIFKPVTYELFHDLGTHWTNYAVIYDLKTDATPEQLQRVVDFSHLVTHASDDEFALRLHEFLDLEQFAAYLAGNVLLSNYDSFFTHGQNFFMYLDPKSDLFGFISWDHDHSWGEFGHYGSRRDRERASIWKPYTYDFRFLERTMGVPAFRDVYKAKLEYALEHLFTKERLFAQIDELAATIRPAVAAESNYRLKRFDVAVSDDSSGNPPGESIHQIKRFIENRIISVRAQLKGESDGVQLGRR